MFSKSDKHTWEPDLFLNLRIVLLSSVSIPIKSNLFSNSEKESQSESSKLSTASN